MSMTEIRSRMEEASRAAELRSFERAYGTFGNMERRTFAHVSTEARMAGTSESGATDGALRIVGHASVFDQPSIEMASPLGNFTEFIDARAFDNVLARKPDVLLTWDHDTRYILGRTENDTLDLTIDAVGLRYWSRVAPTSYAADLKVLMDGGYLNQSSFLFRIAPGGEEWILKEDADGNDIVIRRIFEVGELYDVCVCAAGAYPTTDSGVARTLALEYAVEHGYVSRLRAGARRASKDELRAIGDVAWGPDEGTDDLSEDVERLLNGEDDCCWQFSVVDVSTDLTKVIVCDWNDYSFWVVPISVGADGDPVIADQTEWVQVETAWVTTAEGYEANIRSAKLRREARMSDTEATVAASEVETEPEVEAEVVEETPAEVETEISAEEVPEAVAEVETEEIRVNPAKARLLAEAQARIARAKTIY